MIFDAHAHIGQFYSMHTSPTALVGYYDSVGVDGFAVSSTTICEAEWGEERAKEVYRIVLHDMKELCSIVAGRVSPVLWIVPQMFDDGGLQLFMNSGIDWRCLKIHPQLNKDGWLPDGENMQRLTEIAHATELPILIHTAYNDNCNTAIYKDYILQHPDIKVVLAHGRPTAEAIEVLRCCPNAYIDTAFMATADVALCCEAGLADRVIFGTDYPIPRHFYPDRDMKEYYKTLLSELADALNPKDFDTITCRNHVKVYGK